MLRLIKVSGDSLSPEYQEGDFVIISKIPFFFNDLVPGDTVVFHHPLYGIMIKRVERIEPDGEHVFVMGSHPNSVDSRQFGSLRKRSLLGKVIWHIRRPSA